MRDASRKAGRFWIEIPEAEPSPRRHKIGPDGLLLGRSDECDVVLDDRTVSRHHARIFPSEGFCYVKDLKSHNGVVVNGQKTGYECLSNGDVIELGSFRLVFHSKETPPGSGDEGEKARQAEQFEKLVEEAEETGTAEKLPLHPLAIAGLAFVGLACWFWAFGIGAMVLGTLTFFEIRSGEQYRGTALALTAIIGGLIAGGLNACVRSGGTDLLLARDPAALQCKEQLAAIGEALQEYASQHNGRYPDALAELHPDFLSRPALLRCPAHSGKEPGDGYLFPAAATDNPSGERVIACDDQPRHHNGTGGFVLRANREVEWIPAPRMRLLLMDLEEN
jgi:hypothetical protein